MNLKTVVLQFVFWRLVPKTRGIGSRKPSSRAMFPAVLRFWFFLLSFGLCIQLSAQIRSIQVIVFDSLETPLQGAEVEIFGWSGKLDETGLRARPRRMVV